MMSILDKIRPLFSALNLLAWIAVAIPMLIRGLMYGFAHFNKCSLDGKPCLIGGADRSEILMLPWRADILLYSDLAIRIGGGVILLCFVFYMIDRRVAKSDLERLMASYDRP